VIGIEQRILSTREIHGSLIKSRSLDYEVEEERDFLLDSSGRRLSFLDGDEWT
jgi:hypothetical protein